MIAKRLMLLKYMPPVAMRLTLNSSATINNQIIKALIGNYKKGANQCQTIKKFFKSETPEHACKKVWYFLKKNINYKRDSEDKQAIRLPNRFFYDGYGDCKSYSLAAASILGALGLPVYFRFASYNDSKTPTHVYTVVKINGEDIIIDAVYSEFNKQKEPKYFLDKKLN